MDEAEVDIVAEELAKLGGTAWYPGRAQDPVLRIVTERYRDRARAAIAALDRHRAKSAGRSISENAEAPAESQSGKGPSSSPSSIQIGATVIYRPPGDRRAYVCTIEKLQGGFAYLVPQVRNNIGWVHIGELMGSAPMSDHRAGRPSNGHSPS